ncbi:MAG: hypothetical protein MI892_24015 [Desulfobacterales bacterium]|nr:hypothetical protein [Desulfobacterales bacterium]
MSHKRLSSLAPLALGIGILVSPDNWVLLGNFMGQAGWAGLGILAAVMVFYASFALLLCRSYRQETDLTFLKRPEIWEFATFINRAALALFLSTGILVSAGFVFNEVFVYWFPNFGFAYLLLILIFGIHCFLPRAVPLIQVAFIGLTLAPLLLLIFTGIAFSPPDTGMQAIPLLPKSFPGISIIFLPLILWIGFDLSWSIKGHHKTSTPGVVVIITAGFIFILWGLTSIFNTSLDSLSASGVPHMKTARLILGQTGRYLMGATLIFGTLSAVNALFTGCWLAAEALCDRKVLPPWVRRPVFIPLVLALIISMMMGFGMAGSDNIDTMIQSALLAWLIALTARSAFMIKPSIFSVLIHSTLLFGIISLILKSGSPALSTLCIFAILGASFIPGMVLTHRRMAKRRSP